ncbi:Uncharacterised protein [Serratia fonticola]|nr:Uncharacterised protein [Serratia fonticola]
MPAFLQRYGRDKRPVTVHINISKTNQLTVLAYFQLRTRLPHTFELWRFIVDSDVSIVTSKSSLLAANLIIDRGD